MLTLVTGDDAVLYLALQRNHRPFAISLAAIVQTAIISRDHKTVLAPAVNADPLAGGADWTQARIVVVFPKAVTATITTFGPAKLEIQVSDSYTETWFTDILIVRGLIS